ncbi:DUF429 domain-containing protein [Haloferax sp. Atlit-10N]|uniref:DUF429 domain-containing protein n=1 Tax=Haloferax TaxID=2251 RepID=UPI000677F793|nr:MULTISPECIES: DUF429 domain-containing protein [Haloferax]RDZ47128.1 DUF429 domain-containing protein [Haloferax sp. Atlit-16N]RDZ60959.1 DUF429 domain-containing protein [Haloferax sp. Atlit-10N]
MPQRCTVVGVDGCRSGWVCAVAADGLSVRVVSDFAAVWDLARERDAERVLVDIPIGLPESDRRACDREARELLGARAATVFFAPVRAVLDADSHEAASATNREHTGAGLSIQAWHLVPKIREVDAALRETQRARQRVFESHPELAFAAFAGEPLSESKATAEGRARRLDVLKTAFAGDGVGDDSSNAGATDASKFDAERAYRETLARTLRRDVARDDVLDALALAAAARRPLGTLPSDPPRDAAGLEMAIRVPTGALGTNTEV